jgi:hypothetical protein
VILSPTGLSPSMAPLIQRCSARIQFCNFPGGSSTPEVLSRYPVCTTETTYDIHTVWAIPRSLAATSGVVIYFLFLRILRCFNSPGWLRRPMYSVGDHQGLPGGVSPFGNPRISLLSSYPRLIAG